MNKFKEILFLSNIKGIGPVSLNKTYMSKLSKFKDFDEFKSNIAEILPEKFQDKDLLKNADIITEEVCKQINQYDITPLTVLDDNYPEKLKNLENKTPPILYVKGNIDALSNLSISVIGSRTPSLISENFEKEFINKFIEKTGRTVVSGLALGCDSIAHKIAIDNELPTIAVLPAGVENIIPRENKKLADDIVDTEGCLVSSYRPTERLHRTAYITRDQYTAALGDCCFVVQCSRESGTMYTVNYAKNLNRKIACYLPENYYSFDFTGNEYVLNDKEYGALKIKSLDDLDLFIDWINELESY